MKPGIFVALSTFAQQGQQPLDLLKQSGLTFTVNTTGKRLNKEELIAQGKDSEGIVAGLEPYDQEVFSALPRLKCISRCGVGVDNVDLAAAKLKNIAVLNTPDVVIQPVAELTVALIFDLLRRLSAHTALMRRHQWERLTGVQMAGRKIGIVGLGRIGRRVAQILNRLDADVYGYDLNPDPLWAQQNNVAMIGFHDLLSTCDVVTLHLSITPGFPFCLGEEELMRMKKGAILINVARGSLVDETALVTALQSGHLAGAGLDVYSQEPYSGPLCDFPNVVLTPHVATLTQESRLQMEIECVKNIVRFFK